jgi:MFS family permease
VSLAIGLMLYPLVPNLWTLIAIMPLVPIGTALLFPSTTSLMSQHSARGEVGAVMGTAQTYAGLSRVIAPLAATAAFQRLGHGTPFLLAAGLVVLVGLWTLRLQRPATADPAPTPAQPSQTS